MAGTENSKLKLKVILTALEVDTQELADQIGEQRPVISGIISGTRIATKARRKMAAALSQRMSDLILPTASPEAEKVT